MRIVISYLRIGFHHVLIVGFALGLSLTKIGLASVRSLSVLLCGSLTFRKEPPD